MTWNPEWVSRMVGDRVRNRVRAQALPVTGPAAGRPAFLSDVTGAPVPVTPPPVPSIADVIKATTFPTVPALADFQKMGEQFGQTSGAAPAAAPSPGGVPVAAPTGMVAPAGTAAGAVPMFVNGQVEWRKPLYDPAVTAKYGYQHVGGFNMAPGAQGFRPTGATDLGSLANTYMGQGIAGQALEAGAPQQMTAAQAVGTSLQGLNAAQVASPEVQALLAQLAKEAEFERQFGVPMYQAQQYSSQVY